MKTKTLFLLCLFLGLVLTQLSAQLDPPHSATGNGTVSWWGDGTFSNDVYAPDGVLLKVVVTFDTHAQIRYKDGVIVSIDYQNHGIGVCTNTGEIFKYIEIGKNNFSSWDPFTGYAIFHFNMMGDHGSHVLFKGTLDFSTGAYLDTKISWPGGKYWDGN
jgi:hypothetical protein